MQWAIDAGKAADLGAAHRIVLMVLAHHHHDRTGACFPTISTVAEAAGLRERRTQAILRSLEAMGLITIAKRTERGRQRSNQYDLFGRPRGAACCTPKPAPRGAKQSTPQDARGVHPSAPDRDIYTLGALPADPSPAPTVIAFPRMAGRA